MLGLSQSMFNFSICWFYYYYSFLFAYFQMLYKIFNQFRDYRFYFQILRSASEPMVTNVLLFLLLLISLKQFYCLFFYLFLLAFLRIYGRLSTDGVLSNTIRLLNVFNYQLGGGICQQTVLVPSYLVYIWRGRHGQILPQDFLRLFAPICCILQLNKIIDFLQKFQVNLQSIFLLQVCKQQIEVFQQIQSQKQCYRQYQPTELKTHNKNAQKTPKNIQIQTNTNIIQFNSSLLSANACPQPNQFYSIQVEYLRISHGGVLLVGRKTSIPDFLMCFPMAYRRSGLSHAVILCVCRPLELFGSTWGLCGCFKTYLLCFQLYIICISHLISILLINPNQSTKKHTTSTPTPNPNSKPPNKLPHIPTHPQTINIQTPNRLDFNILSYNWFYILTLKSVLINNSIHMRSNQLIQDYDDMFAGLDEEIMKNLFIRFYTMEEYFQFTLEEDYQVALVTQTEENVKKPDDPKKVLPVTMVYNKVIQQCLYDLNIMNKLVAAKSKTVNLILDNGKNISSKKNEHWKQLINQPSFPQLHKAYKLMKNAKKNIIKYAVMSISNLLLKLSINMSKVSVIPIQRFLNFECLSIPTLSVVFLQYMQYKLYKSKNIPQDQTQFRVNFLKQLPKITFVKFSKYLNNTDIELLQTSQSQFITKQLPPNVNIKNLQFIHIHQCSQDPIMPEYKRKTNYQHIYILDLQKLANGKIKPPYTFQMLQVMRQLVFPQIRQFKTDLIVYLQSFNNLNQVMDDQVRALMLCQMSEETCCNKIYVMKQLGQEKFNIPQYIKTLEKSSQMSQEPSQEGEKINDQVNRIFEQYESQYANKFLRKQITSEQKKQLQKMKKIFLNQTCYTSLALIQKTSFDRALQKSHRFLHQQELLKGIFNQQQRMINRVDKSQQALAHYFRSLKLGVQSMIQVLKFRKQQKRCQNGEVRNTSLKIITLTEKQQEFKTFYNILTEKTQTIQIEQIEQNTSKITRINFTQQDTFIVKYYEQPKDQKRLVIILISNNLVPHQINLMLQENQQRTQFVKMLVLSKKLPQKYFKKERQLFLPALQHYLEDPTYVLSNDYLFRGFGRFKINKTQNSQNYNLAIHRFRINGTFSQEWQLVGTQAIPVKQNGQEQKPVVLEKKIQGYGIFDIQNKSILFMGGYIDSSNQQRINKNIYLIKSCQSIDRPQKINILGKTNRIVFTPSSQKTKQLFLYPFVFGIPFYIPGPNQKNSAFILNSNGYYLNLSLLNKIFSSSMKLSSTIYFNGVMAQNKLKLSTQVQNAAKQILISQILIKCTTLFTKQINMKGSICCVQTLEEGEIVIRITNTPVSVFVTAKEIFEDNQNKIQFI